MKKIAVLNGPNLDRLGKREPEIYGTQTLEDLANILRSSFPTVAFDFLQSNHEGALVDKFAQRGIDAQLVGLDPRGERLLRETGGGTSPGH